MLITYGSRRGRSCLISKAISSCTRSLEHSCSDNHVTLKAVMMPRHLQRREGNGGESTILYYFNHLHSRAVHEPLYTIQLLN